MIAGEPQVDGQVRQVVDDADDRALVTGAPGGGERFGPAAGLVDGRLPGAGGDVVEEAQ